MYSSPSTYRRVRNSRATSTHQSRPDALAAKLGILRSEIHGQQIARRRIERCGELLRWLTRAVEDRLEISGDQPDRIRLRAGLLHDREWLEVALEERPHSL